MVAVVGEHLRDVQPPLERLDVAHVNEKLGADSMPGRSMESFVMRISAASLQARISTARLRTDTMGECVRQVSRWPFRALERVTMGCVPCQYGHGSVRPSSYFISASHEANPASRLSRHGPMIVS